MAARRAGSHGQVCATDGACDTPQGDAGRGGDLGRADPMRCNDAGLSIIKQFEGCRLSSYQDSGGIWTVGYGHTGTEVVPDLTWTQDQADAQLADDIVGRAETPIDTLVKYELDDNKYSALVSFVFNIGSGNFAKSAVLTAINAGDLDDAPTHMNAWVHDRAGNVDKGLVRRRSAEIELYETPVDDDSDEMTA